MRAWWMMAAALVATPPVSADQFDLVCRGGREEWRFRVDLSRNEWCAEGCGRVQKIASATTGTLTLVDQRPAYRGDDEVRNTIDRATGEWTFYRELPSIGFGRTIHGKCEPANFSGFPAVKF